MRLSSHQAAVLSPRQVFMKSVISANFLLDRNDQRASYVHSNGSLLNKGPQRMCALNSVKF